jgi:hypothetical protein
MEEAFRRQSDGDMTITDRPVATPNSRTAPISSQAGMQRIACHSVWCWLTYAVNSVSR